MLLRQDNEELRKLYLQSLQKHKFCVNKLRKKRTPIVKSLPSNRQRRCPTCLQYASFMPVSEKCWTRDPEMNNLLTITTKSFDDAQSRLNKNSNSPPNINSLTNPQKRLIVYLKIFRFFFGEGNAGERKHLPDCMVGRVRRTYPSPQYSDGSNFTL